MLTCSLHKRISNKRSMIKALEKEFLSCNRHKADNIRPRHARLQIGLIHLLTNEFQPICVEVEFE